MPSLLRSRGQSPADHLPAPIVLPELPVDTGSVHTRRVRKAVGYTRNVATVATAVPFMPLPARVAAGAVTGVATVVDAALRPSTERPAGTMKPAPTDDEILHDPALFAADAAGALATGVLAAGEALVVSAKSPALRRVLKMGVVASVVITVGALGYKLVVGPALVRRMEAKKRERALIVLSDTTDATILTTPVSVPDADGIVGGGEAGIADVLAEAAAEPIVEVLVVEEDIVESVEDSTAAEAGAAQAAAGAEDAEAAAAAGAEDAEAAAAAEAEAAPKKRRFGRRAAAAQAEGAPASDAAPADGRTGTDLPDALPSQD